MLAFLSSITNVNILKTFFRTWSKETRWWKHSQSRNSRYSFERILFL